MKHSIKKIFRNLSFFLAGMVAFAVCGVLTTLGYSNSYAKIDNLENQKMIMASVVNLPKENLELTLIKLNGKAAQLQHEVDKLRTLYKFNFIEKYVLSNSKEYLEDLDRLSYLTTEFSKEAREYYPKKIGNLEPDEAKLESSFNSAYGQIDSMLISTISYSQSKFNFLKYLLFAAFLIIILTSLWYRKRLIAIYKDLESLHDADRKTQNYFSKEIESISHKIRKKLAISENPAMLDPVTGINNIKGMINSYSEKKGMKDNNFTSVTILEVDNFSKSNQVYSQEFTQTILKKIAFTISLHEQVTDVIARTDYNQFIIILSRPNKEASFKEIDNLRQSISELKLSSPELGAVEITVSGGYIIKPNNVSLEESIRQAKKILLHAQKGGKNTISQIKDLAHSEL